MAAGVFDSYLFGDAYGTAEMRKVFDDLTLIGNWVLAEATLAKCQATLGIIPENAAAEIQRIARMENFDIDGMKGERTRSAHTIVALVRTLQKLCDGDAGEYIHWGATTQDIMDIGFVLQIRDGLEIVERDIRRFCEILKEQAMKHRNTVMAGRTHGQQAVPITLGYKVAVWVEETRRHIARILRCKEIALHVQFSGAAGTLATIEPTLGFKLQQLLANELQLRCPRITWHTSRDSFVETVSVLGMIGGTMGKIANEIINLQRTEIGELEEPWWFGAVGSSTMPHKRNPSKCEHILLLSRLVRNLVPLMFEDLIMEHERDWFSRGCEQKTIGEAFLLTAAMLRDVIQVVEGITVNAERMRSNLDLTRGLIMSEKIMMELGRRIGKQTAHEVVYKASQQAFANNRSLLEALQERPEVSGCLSADELKGLFEPTSYLGLATAYVDRVCENRESGEAAGPGR
jgi:3-carboxy-cis,cis-muconate cycloisomerase